MSIKTIFKRSYIYIASFAIPFVILGIAYMVNGIYPGSEKNIFISDMGGQYIGFYSYLRYVGIGYNNIMFQTLGGLGGGYFGTWAYYTSDPLGLLVLLFDPAKLSDAFYFLTLFKVSLCGLTFSLYLKNGHVKCKYSFVIIVSSVSYALMSYNIIYSLNIMWLSGVYMLPLVILGIDNIIEDKRKELFIFVLAYSVIINFYTAYMIVLFCVIYFLYRTCCDGFDKKRFISHLFELFLCGLLSALLSAWLWIPVLMDLTKGKLTEDSVYFYGLIRNPFGVLKQLFPFSYDGISSKSMPPAYCGFLVTVFLLLYFFQKKIVIRKKIAAFCVYIFFIISFSFNFLDVFWQCLRMPNGFPGRYTFTFSFFVISLFSESVELLFDSIKKRFFILLHILTGFIVFADLLCNSVYLITSLGEDPAVGGYSYNSNYYDGYIKSEYYKALGYDYPSRIASYDDYSHVDGFVYGFSSLDYYSSSYNHKVSDFLRSLGLNSYFHYSQDSGITPVTASLLNVRAAVSYNEINEYGLMFEMYDPVYFGNGFALYENPYPGSLGYTYNEDTFINSISGNVFENINHLYHDLTGENVFIKCNRVDKISIPFDEDATYSREITLFPEKGKHLFMYVSPDDYFEDDKKECVDYLYFGGDLVASYTNMPDRYIADLGYCDGSDLTFTFESDNEDNEIFFYLMDDELFVNSVDALSKRGLYNITYSKNGIRASVDSTGYENLAVFLPYESGYKIYVDGTPADYTSYGGSVISLPIEDGVHDIHISYTTPGLMIGILLCVLGIIITSVYEFSRYLCVLHKKAL